MGDEEEGLKGASSDCLKGVAYVDRTDEVFVTRENVNEDEAKEDSGNPCADETFDGLFGREFDELSATEGDAADVSPNVVCDDEAGRHEEPDHAFKDVVHNEMCLDDNQVEGHVCPGELGELEAIMAFLERGDEEDEA